MNVNRLARWLVLALAMGLAIAGAVLQLQPDEEGRPLLHFTQAEFIKSDDPAPPRDGAQWVPRHLPDNWRSSNPGLSGYGWYRIVFDLEQAPADPWAAYLPSVGTTYQLYLNGIDIGGGGGMTGAFNRTVGKPQLDPIAPQVLQEGENELLLRLRVAPNLRGGLGPLTLGPRILVEARYDQDYFARVTLTRSLNMALVFVGLLVLLLWLRRPEERIYGTFAALAIVWSIRNFHYTMYFTGIPSNVWEAFILASLGLVVVLLWRFMLRFTGGAWPRAERWATVGAVIALPLLAVLDPRAVSALRIPWYLACAAVGVLAISVLVRFLRTPAGKTRAGAWVILAALVLTLLLGLTDLAVSAQLLPFGPAAHMAFGAPILLCALVYALAESYFRTYDQVRTLNVELERRVSERTDELRRTYERLRSLERVATLAHERERLMRDMHDGVGSQLITTLDAVERGDTGAQGVAALLRSSIDDLRLVIDSLEPDEQSLQLALANLRWRLEPRLAAAGIALEWDVDGAPQLRSPGQVLQVLRIVQEAVTNTLKHAQSTRLRVRLSSGTHGMLLEVSDNGIGRDVQRDGSAPAAAETEGETERRRAADRRIPPPRPPGAGRGIGNMQLRASQLGGSLEVAIGAGGTSVRLLLPQTSSSLAPRPAPDPPPASAHQPQPQPHPQPQDVLVLQAANTPNEG